MTETEKNPDQALTLKQAAQCLQLSYGTVFARRHAIAFRLPGSRIWRVWPKDLAALQKPRNNVYRLSLRTTQKEQTPCPSAKTPAREFGGLIYARQKDAELDALLRHASASRRRNTTTGSKPTCGGRAS